MAKYATPHGPRICVMAAVSYHGLLSFRMIKLKTFNGRRFIRFLRSEIVPLLNAYDGRNPNSVVIMVMAHDS